MKTIRLLLFAITMIPCISGTRGRVGKAASAHSEKDYRQYIFIPLHNAIINDKEDNIKYALGIFIIVVLILTG